MRCPLFTNRKRQLSCHEVDWSHEISQVRIHIEHVIDQLKQNFKLLEGVVPINMLNEKNPTDTTYIDCILTVYAALYRQFISICSSIYPYTSLTHTPTYIISHAFIYWDSDHVCILCTMSIHIKSKQLADIIFAVLIFFEI